MQVVEVTLIFAISVKLDSCCNPTLAMRVLQGVLLVPEILILALYAILKTDSTSTLKTFAAKLKTVQIARQTLMHALHVRPVSKPRQHYVKHALKVAFHVQPIKIFVHYVIQHRDTF